MLPTFQGGIPDRSVALLPNINISVTVQEESVHQGGRRGEVLEWALPQAVPWASPGHVTMAVLLVFVLSPVAICSNSLLLVAVYRFKRLRNPSNYFVVSLASADLGVGLLLPPGLYFEFSRAQVHCIVLCLLPYCILILLCSVSLLSITAVALDRYTSLASPLRYNNIITHRSVLRYIAAFWMYSLILSSSPVIFWFYTTPASLTDNCSFSLVLPPVRVFLFSLLFAPCALLLVLSYGYVYVIARSHARAIFSVEVTFRQHPCSDGPRYGRTLAATVGLFLLLWLPFQICMLMGTLTERTTFYLGMLVLANTAADPWMYGYRSSDFRLASIRILESVAPHLSSALYKPQSRRHSVPFTSCASHARMGTTPNPPTHTADTMCVTYMEATTAANPFVSSMATATVGAAQL